MQSYDERDRIIDSKMLEAEIGPGLPLPKAESVLSAMKEARAKGAVKHVIANMPGKGETVEILGLKYLVRGVNNENGSLHLKLIAPE